MPKIPLRALLPSRTPTILLWIAASVFIFGLLLGIAYGFSEPARFFALFSVVVGIFALPLIAVLLEIGTWIEKNPIPRFILGILTLTTVLLGSLIGTLAISLDEAEFSPVLSFIICTLPIFCIFAIPVILAAIKLPAALRQAARDEIKRKAEFLLLFQEEAVPFEKIAAETGLPVEKVGRLLNELVQNHQIAGVIETEHSLFLPADLIDKKQTQLLGMVQAHGALHIDDVAAELNIPPELIHTWLYALIQKGRFKGSINWKEKMLYSQEAAQLPQDKLCPQCGGQLTLAGKGVLICDYCETDFFLAE